ncbi:MAG: RNA polymerase sigma factor [Flavobacteriales bacterium]|nr:RNA polymerase sigma factor [Flavobacteriales bacterium]
MTNSQKLKEMNVDQQFIELHPLLKSYLYRLTANKQDMEDILQETYIRVNEKISSFRGESTFKTWVFAIATNLARDNKRVQNRWADDVQDRCRAAADASVDVQNRMLNAFADLPEKKFEFAEHINYCFTCLSKNLSLEKQIAVILKEVFDFTRMEIASILHVSEGSVKHTLHNGRKELQEKFDNRCALINKNGPCYQCSQLNDYFQGDQTAQEKVSNLKLKTQNDSEENFIERMNLVKLVDPVHGNGAHIEDTILQILRETIQDQ